MCRPERAVLRRGRLLLQVLGELDDRGQHPFCVRADDRTDQRPGVEQPRLIRRVVGLDADRRREKRRRAGDGRRGRKPGHVSPPTSPMVGLRPATRIGGRCTADSLTSGVVLRFDVSDVARFSIAAPGLSWRSHRRSAVTWGLVEAR